MTRTIWTDMAIAVCLTIVVLGIGLIGFVATRSTDPVTLHLPCGDVVTSDRHARWSPRPDGNCYGEDMP